MTVPLEVIMELLYVNILLPKLLCISSMKVSNTATKLIYLCKAQ